MDLQAFLKEALVQISNGIEDAQKVLKDTNGRVNPALSIHKGLHENRGDLVSRCGKLVYNVEFDVAVTVTDKTGTKGGAGIFVAGLGVGSKLEDSSSASRVSRIQFKVPVTYPEMEA